MPYSNAARVRRAMLAMVCCLALAGGVGAAQSESTFAFVGVNVIPMDTEQVLLRHTVVVQGDRIIAIDPADEASLPDGTRRVDAQGKYLIPGLIDVHARLLSDDRIEQGFVDEELAVMVANGVTTWRDPIGGPYLLDYRRRMVAADAISPTVYVASPLLASVGAAEAPDRRVLTTPLEAAATVRELAAIGYDFASLGADLSPDVYQGIVLTARGARMPIIGSVPPAVGLRRALEAGQQIAHLDGYLEALMGEGPPAVGLSGSQIWNPDNWSLLDHIDEGRIEEVVRATVDAEAWNVPTLASYAAIFGSARTAADIEQGPEYRFVSPSVRADLLGARERFWSSPPAAARRQRFVELRNRLVRDLYRAGANLLAGSGAPEGMLLYGFTVHRELQALVDAGLPPFAALRCATASPAALLSVGGGAGRTEYATVDEGTIRFESATTAEVDFGGIAVGMRADMVLLASNPLDDIGNTRDIEGVVLRGRWLPREQLDAMLDRAAERLAAAPLKAGSRE